MTPAIIVGLPSLVLYDAIERSKGTNGIILHTGIHVTENNLPVEMFTRGIYDAIIKIKNEIVAAEFTDIEKLYLRRWLITDGDESKCKIGDNIDEEIKKYIKRCAFMIKNEIIGITRLPGFTEKFRKATSGAQHGEEIV